MDIIGNMLVSLRNAGAIRKEKISVPFSKLTLSILNLLKEEGYVKAVKDNAAEYKIEAANPIRCRTSHARRSSDSEG